MNRVALTVTAVQAVLSALVLLDAFDLSSEALAGIGLAVGAVLTAGHAWFDRSIPFGPTDGDA